MTYSRKSTGATSSPFVAAVLLITHELLFCSAVGPPFSVKLERRIVVTGGIIYVPKRDRSIDRAGN